MKYKIEIKRGGCIACGVCYSTDPSHFEPDDEGKSTVIGGITDTNGSYGIFNDEDFENTKNAEDSCPVSIIRVTEL
jgi:ferredoxin